MRFFFRFLPKFFRRSHGIGIFPYDGKSQKKPPLVINAHPLVVRYWLRCCSVLPIRTVCGTKIQNWPKKSQIFQLLHLWVKLLARFLFINFATMFVIIANQDLIKKKLGPRRSVWTSDVQELRIPVHFYLTRTLGGLKHTYAWGMADRRRFAIFVSRTLWNVAQKTIIVDSRSVATHY